MTRLNLFVVSGGLSEESSTHRLADALTRAVENGVASRGGQVDVTRVDVRDLAHDIASASLTGYATGELAAAYTALGTADGIVAVTPTYKASYTGLFKAFWDVTDDGALSGVPTLLGATGGSPRHSLVTDTALRPLFSSMRALTMPTAVFAAAADWGDRGLSERIDRAGGELARAMTPSGEPGSGTASAADVSSALQERRRRVSDPFASAPTMGQLLRG